MKLLVLIGTDCHLKQLPHFLAHYAAIGVDQFVCGLHGHGADQARALLARYPFVIVADYGTEPYDEVAHRHWGMHFNDFRRQYCQPCPKWRRASGGARQGTCSVVAPAA